MSGGAETIVYPFKDLNVLVVDDDAVMTRLLRGVLEAFGFNEVDVYNDGIKAFARTSIKHYSFIICDWKMSKISGIEFVEKIREDSHSPNRFTPIIMLTGKNAKEDVCKARDSGVNEFITKPFTVTSLRTRIIEIIENPRSFIISRNYVGPDRRRKKMPLPPGTKERRTSDEG